MHPVHGYIYILQLLTGLSGVCVCVCVVEVSSVVSPMISSFGAHRKGGEIDLFHLSYLKRGLFSSPLAD